VVWSNFDEYLAIIINPVILMAISIIEAQQRPDLVRGSIQVPGVRIELCAFPEVEPDNVVVTEEFSILSLGLSRLLSGSAGRVAGDQRIPYRRFGALGFRPAGIPMEMRVAGGAFHTLRCRFEDWRIADSLGADLLSEAALAACFDIRSPSMEEVMLRLAAEVDQKRDDSTELAEALISVLLIDLKRYLRDADARAHRRRGGLTPRMLRQVLERIDSNGPPPEIDELAAICGLSRFHFLRSFRDMMGVSPGAFIRQTRMTRAKALLTADERRPLAEIAAELGYSGSAAFCAAFRQAVGRTPTAYRMLMR